MQVDTLKWKQNISKAPKDVETEYDGISESYDSYIMSQGYKAPEDSAKILQSYVEDKNASILDAGCGTGLIGLHLNKQGFTNITGIDISANSIKQAKEKGVYINAVKHNLLEPFPFENSSFDAVTCIGVCSRFDDIEILLIIKEIARVVRKDGIIIISHREDLMKSSKLVEMIEKYQPSGIKVKDVLGPYPYIPMDPNYKNINVSYIVLNKSL